MIYRRNAFSAINRETVSDTIRGQGTEETYSNKGYPGRIYNQLLFEAKADHIVNTVERVKKEPIRGTCYFNSTAGVFQDSEDNTVTFSSGEKILWSGLDTLSANIDISAIDYLEHIMLYGVILALGSYNLLLGENQRGELDLSGTGTITILSSDGLRLKTSSTLTIDNQDGDIFIDNSYAATTAVNWLSATQLGSSFSISGAGNTAISTLDQVTIAYIDDALEELRAYAWDGETYSLSGSAFSISGIANPSITSLSSTDIAYIDTTLESLRNYAWSGSVWSLSGSGLFISGIGVPSITALTSTSIAYIDSTNEELRTYSWSGSAWSLTGSGLSITGTGTTEIAAISSTKIALVSTGLGVIRTYSWSGSAWSLDSGDLSVSLTGQSSATSINSTDIVVYNSSEFKIYRYNGYKWELNSTTTLINGSGVAAIAAINGLDIAYIDDTNENLETYRYDYSISQQPFSI